MIDDSADTEEVTMGSKQKPAQLEHKVQFEKQLAERLAYLNDQGMEPERINKDMLVKKLKAKVKAINLRLKAIDAYDKRTEELAQIKAEKLAAPPKESKGKKKPEPAAPAKGGEKKKKKKAE